MPGTAMPGTAMPSAAFPGALPDWEGILPQFLFAATSPGLLKIWRAGTNPRTQETG